MSDLDDISIFELLEKETEQTLFCKKFSQSNQELIEFISNIFLKNIKNEENLNELKNLLDLKKINLTFKDKINIKKKELEDQEKEKYLLENTNYFKQNFLQDESIEIFESETTKIAFLKESKKTIEKFELLTNFEFSEIYTENCNSIIKINKELKEFRLQNISNFEEIKKIYKNLELNKDESREILSKIFDKINETQEEYKKFSEEEKKDLKICYRKELFNFFYYKNPYKNFFDFLNVVTKNHKILKSLENFVTKNYKILKLVKIDLDDQKLENKLKNNSSLQLIFLFFYPLSLFAKKNQPVEFTNSDFRNQIILCLNSLKNFYQIENLQDLELNLDFVQNDQIIPRIAFFSNLEFSFKANENFNKAQNIVKIYFSPDEKTLSDDSDYQKLENKTKILTFPKKLYPQELIPLVKIIKYETYDTLYEIDEKLVEKFFDIGYSKINFLITFCSSNKNFDLTKIFLHLNEIGEKKTIENFFKLSIENFKKTFSQNSFFEQENNENKICNQLIAQNIFKIIQEKISSDLSDTKVQEINNLYYGLPSTSF